MTSGLHTVVIVGGGIGGLATAYELTEQAGRRQHPLSCVVVESSPAWGGKIVTHRARGCVIEAGPDSFLSQKPWALDLCQRLGLSDQLMNTNDRHRKAFVYSRGRLRELPEGLVVIVPSNIGAFMRSGVLSWRGLVRMGMEYLLPSKPSGEDESLAKFFRRRFGTEATACLIEPLMAGIYAGDAEQMSIKATFPRFPELERRYGSVIRGLLAAGKPSVRTAREGSGYSLFVTLKNGLADLVDALVTRIDAGGGRVHTRCALESLRVRSKEPGRWVYDLQLSDGRRLTSDAVVLATPAFAAADLVRPLSPSAAVLLERIPYASTATISMLYPEQEVRTLMDGFGFVVPRAEQRCVLAATWTSLKWTHRAPAGKVLVRCYTGGVDRESILAHPDDVLVSMIRDELARLSGLRGVPEYVEVNRWERAMPQYTLGHLDRLEDIEGALSRFPGLFLTGSGYRGVGIPDCIRDGQETATRVSAYLGWA